MKTKTQLLIAAVMLAASFPARSAEQVLTIAVFDFQASEDVGRDLGPKASTLITANLSAAPNLITVERAELAKLLGEQELGASGTIASDTAAKIGHLTGAKVLVTGRIFKADREVVMVAKIIGTETGRVFGEIVKANAAVSAVTDLSSEMAKKIEATVEKKAETLVAKAVTREDHIEKIKKSLNKAKLPAVQVKIPERHFGGPTFDPAAETEMGRILQQCGFTVVDDKSDQKPDIEITGEAFSEFGMRKGNLVSCKARIEIKARERSTGKLIAVDRQTSVAVNISEQIAAKTALQEAAAELAERVIPKLSN